MSKQKWEVKTHEEKPNWGVGDYDEYYEIVNDRGDALQTSDDFTGLQLIAEALNAFEGNIRITTALEINQHCDNQMLKMENEHLKAENIRMRKALEIIRDGFDHEDDAHKYQNLNACPVCIAISALKTITL